MRKEPFISFRFEKLPKANWPLIFFFLVAVTAFTSIVNLIVFRANFLLPAAEATSGLIQSTLIVSLGGFVLIVGGIFIYAGRLRKEDIGLRLKLIPQAAVVTIGLWIGLQIIGIVINLTSGKGLVLDSMWQEATWTVVLGAIAAQLFGNALLEETEYRGFLLPQLFHKLKAKWFTRHRNYRIAVALVISQLIFSVSHVPNRIFTGLPLSEWPLNFFTLLGIGILYAFIYLRTGNLFIAVGFHSLGNVPVSLFISQDLASNIVLVAGLVLIFLWRPSWRRDRSLFQGGFGDR